MNLRDRLCLLLSQAVNALVYDGDPDESLSARRHREGKPEAIDRWFGDGHCEAAHAAQMKRYDSRKT